ncbi:Short-chain dehydrogenase/reductase SDR [Lasiodiplodia theobromae]|uniref:Short-chain dehydrogenase/reductase SDR n=1 Tax=Lasiodiplodia theobromae TaxID=45133 RepID=UPI0015C3A6D6|nr:Short-chain dehydrogenase/reductase SDR [Lasiodiplodia theobromae]KAF4546036.1 Short-chain dehydrogenase/reductase SDR [Lasiodiplodia theobromae]
MEKYCPVKTLHRSMYPAIDPTNPANSAAGKTVAISGGGGGIGYAIARGFCKAGASTVILLGRRQAVLDEASAKLHADHGTTIWTYSLDVRDASTTNTTFASIRERLRSASNDSTADVDVLVANAAVLDQGEVSLEFDPAVIQNAFATNVFGVANLARAFLAPELPAIPNPGWKPGVDPVGTKKDTTARAAAPARAKVLIEVSSAATHMIFPGLALYSATKLAATHFVRHLQAELDRMPGQPVRVHSFHPGALYTPGVEALGIKEEVLQGDDISLPEGFAVWLASPAAAFLKGRLPWAAWDVEELLKLKAKFEEDPDFCTVSMKL